VCLRLAAKLRGGIADLPPRSPSFQKRLRPTSGLGVFLGVGKLGVAANGNDAGPLVRAGDVVYLDANTGIRAHPFDFLAHGGKTVETTGLVCEIDGNNVGLVVARTGQPAKACASEKIIALLPVQ